jgi:hypothetical protein
MAYQRRFLSPPAPDVWNTLVKLNKESVLKAIPQPQLTRTEQRRLHLQAKLRLTRIRDEQAAVEAARVEKERNAARLEREKQPKANVIATFNARMSTTEREFDALPKVQPSPMSPEHEPAPDQSEPYRPCITSPSYDHSQDDTAFYRPDPNSTSQVQLDLQAPEESRLMPPPPPRRPTQLQAPNPMRVSTAAAAAMVSIPTSSGSPRDLRKRLRDGDGDGDGRPADDIKRIKTLEDRVKTLEGLLAAAHDRTCAPAVLSDAMNADTSTRAGAVAYSLSRGPMMISWDPETRTPSVNAAFIATLKNAQAAVLVMPPTCAETTTAAFTRIYCVSPKSRSIEEVYEVSLAPVSAFIAMHEYMPQKDGVCTQLVDMNVYTDAPRGIYREGERCIAHIHTDCKLTSRPEYTFAPNVLYGSYALDAEIEDRFDRWWKDRATTPMSTSLFLLTITEVFATNQLMRDVVGARGVGINRVAGIEQWVRFALLHNSEKDGTNMDAKRIVAIGATATEYTRMTTTLQAATKSAHESIVAPLKAVFWPRFTPKDEMMTKLAKEEESVHATDAVKRVYEIVLYTFMMQYCNRFQHKLTMHANVIHSMRRPLSFVCSNTPPTSYTVKMAAGDALNAFNTPAHAHITELVKLHKSDDGAFIVLLFDRAGVSTEAISCSMTMAIDVFLGKEEPPVKRSLFEFVVFEKMHDGHAVVVFSMLRFYYQLVTAVSHLLWRWRLTAQVRQFGQPCHDYIRTHYRFAPILQQLHYMLVCCNKDGEGVTSEQIPVEIRKWASKRVYDITSSLAKRNDNDNKMRSPLTVAKFPLVDERVLRVCDGISPAREVRLPEAVQLNAIDDIIAGLTKDESDIAKWHDVFLQTPDGTHALVGTRLALASVNGDIHYADNSMLISTLPFDTCTPATLWNDTEQKQITDAYLGLRTCTPLSFERVFRALWAAGKSMHLDTPAAVKYHYNRMNGYTATI